MRNRDTLNKQGKCDCGSTGFSMLEHVYSNAVLADGVLYQVEAG